MSTNRKLPASKQNAMKTCFISAPVNLDLSVLRSVLRSKGIATILPFELEITGANFRAQIEKAIQKADFFVGVLSGRASNANVFFELGLASAKRKRVVLIQGRDLELPSNLSGFPILKCKVEDPRQLSYFLDQFLNRQRALPSPPQELAKTRPLSNRAGELIAHLEALGEGATELEFLNILTDVFRESGIQVLAEHGPMEHGYDLAVWLDELEHLVGNPLLVDLRKHLSPAMARVIKRQFLANQGASIGKALLVVFIRGSEEQLRKENLGAPLIMFISAARLLSHLKSRSIAAFIRHDRNKLAHGI